MSSIIISVREIGESSRRLNCPTLGEIVGFTQEAASTTSSLQASEGFVCEKAIPEYNAGRSYVICEVNGEVCPVYERLMEVRQGHSQDDKYYPDEKSRAVAS